MRGSWYFKKSDGAYQPYAEDVAQRLQEAFFGASSEPSSGNDPEAGVNVGWGRVVRMEKDGEGDGTGFVQVRDDVAERARAVVVGRFPAASSTSLQVLAPLALAPTHPQTVLSRDLILGSMPWLRR